MNRNPTTAFCAAVLASAVLWLVLYTYSPHRTPEYHFQYEIANNSIHEDGTSIPNQSLPPKPAHTDKVTSRPSAHGSFDSTQDTTLNAMNRTLGFQEVFVITLPERTDRLDAFTVQAGLTGIHFNVEAGIHGDTVAEKSLPLGMTAESLGLGAIGCWRAHLNVFQKMVQHDIQSALIFEDDADWDIAIKHQMLDVARGTRWLLNSTGDRTGSPYGDEWDVIWIGHNSVNEFSWEREPRRWVTPHDPTVIPPGARSEFQKPEMGFWDNHTAAPELYSRLLYRTNWGSVTAAYAISLRGALKMMYHQSMLPFDQPVDNGMGHMCGFPEENSNFTCIAPFPRLVAAGIAPGRSDKKTDIQGKPDDEIEIDLEAHSHFVMYSAKMNVDGLLRGDKTFSARYGGEIGPTEMHWDDITKIRGHGEVLQQHDDGTFYAKIDEESWID